MAVKIRLSRIGKKKVPFFRVIAIDERKKRDGAFLENIGTYDVLNGQVVIFNEERYNDWISKGAVPTDSAKKVYRLFKKVGVTNKGARIKKISTVEKSEVAQQSVVDVQAQASE